jgi:hypothetical protein
MHRRLLALRCRHVSPLDMGEDNAIGPLRMVAPGVTYVVAVRDPSHAAPLSLSAGATCDLTFQSTRTHKCVRPLRVQCKVRHLSQTLAGTSNGPSPRCSIGRASTPSVALGTCGTMVGTKGVDLARLRCRGARRAAALHIAARLRSPCRPLLSARPRLSRKLRRLLDN